MVKVKICGITNLKDALLASDLGADMIGLNFYENSPRYISPNVAKAISTELPDEALKVGVFVNAAMDFICEVTNEVGLDLVQLHGDESYDDVIDLKLRSGKEVIKVFRIGDATSIAGLMNFDSDAILLDSAGNEFGGTGKSFDWNLAGDLSSKKMVFLAGGLNPENVAKAIRIVRPFAVDVASGVESEKGKKDPEKMKAFIRNAKNA